MRRNVGEGIECAAGPFASHTRNRAQPLNNAFPPPGVFREHYRHRLHRSAHRFEGGVLCDRSCIRRRLALQLDERLDQRLRAKRVADAPAGHGESLRNRADDDHAFFRARSAGDRIRLVRIVGEM